MAETPNPQPTELPEPPPDELSEEEKSRKRWDGINQLQTTLDSLRLHEQNKLNRRLVKGHQDGLFAMMGVDPPEDENEMNVNIGDRHIVYQSPPPTFSEPPKQIPEVQPANKTEVPPPPPKSGLGTLATLGLALATGGIGAVIPIALNHLSNPTSVVLPKEEPEEEHRHEEPVKPIEPPNVDFPEYEDTKYRLDIPDEE